jgi:transposase
MISKGKNVPIKLNQYRGIWWALYTGMQWKCLPVPHDPEGKPAIHYTTVYRVFAKWADDGSLWRAFIASARHLAAEKHPDTSVLHGDGTNTVAKKGGMALGTQGINTRRVRRLLPSSTIMAMSERLSPWLPSMRRTWCCCRRGCTP